MLGAIAGDIIGSVYEGAPVKTTCFPLFSASSRFTDDTVLTAAVADALLRGADYCESLRTWGRRYPDAGYGGSFFRWLWSPETRAYGSWGNGSAMRISPVGFGFDTEVDVLEQARRCSSVTHDHPEGIKGAQATALAILLARRGADRETIREELSGRFGYDLNRRLDDIRPGYRFDVSCQGSVPEAIICFLESTDLESAIRNAVSLGGDADTQGCIAGGIAQAFYGRVPVWIAHGVRIRLPQDLNNVVDRFNARFLD